MKSRREFTLGMVKALTLAALSERVGLGEVQVTHAVDCHAHIFTQKLQLAQVHRYAPDYDATLEQYLMLLQIHGMTNGVLVQPSFLGTDNAYLLAALKSHPKKLRGIAVIDPSLEFEQMQQMRASGCVGIRLNLVGLPDPGLTGAAWKQTLEKLRRVGWMIQIQAEAHRLPHLVAPIIDNEINVVVDHFGRPKPVLGVEDPGFRYLLSTGKTRRVWVKLSGAYRNGANGQGERTAFAAVPLLKSAFGLDRLLWGSDWPHTQFERSMTYDLALGLFFQLLPDPAERHAVLWGTPSKLFGFIA